MAFITVKLAYKRIIRKPQKIVGIILGIALGVALLTGVMVGVASLKASFTNSFLHTLGERDAFFSYSPYGEIEVMDQSLIEALDLTAFQGVEAATARLRVDVSVFSDEQGTLQPSVVLNGISPNETGFLPFYDDYDKSNVLVLNESTLLADRIFIGAGLAEEMKLEKGDQITVSFGFGNMSIFGDFLIQEIYNEDKGKGREGFGFNLALPLSRLQDMINTASEAIGESPTVVTNKVNMAYLNIEDEFEEDKEFMEELFTKIRAKIAVVTGLPLEMIEYTFEFTMIRVFIIDMIDQMMTMMSQMLNTFGALIIAAGLLVIVNIQLMAMEERENQTGILRAIGAKRRTIIISTLIESIFLGLIASVIGLLGGMGYGWFLGWVFAYSFDFAAEDIPLIVTQSTLIWSFVFGFIIAVVSGIYPSLRASRINIVDVLRGITRLNPKKMSKKSIYFGSMLSIGAIIWLTISGFPPLWEGKEAFRNIDKVEKMYIPILLVVLGPAIMASYFWSKRISLNVGALFMIGWPLFIITWALEWIEEGDGGMWLIGYCIISMIIGNVLLMGINLDFFASIGEKVVGVVPRLRATGMVAFRQMSSNKTRSTLTFALFATILSMNIFMAAFNASMRYGLDDAMEEISGNTDIIVSITSPIPKANQTAVLIQEEAIFNNRVDLVRPLTITRGLSYLITDPTNSSWRPNPLNETEAENIVSNYNVAIANDTFWDDEGNWFFKYGLEHDKYIEFEDGVVYQDDEIVTNEDQLLWKALSENRHVNITNPDNESETISVPIIITTRLMTFENFQVTFLKEVGDLVYLEDNSGALKPYLIAGFAIDNPLINAFQLSGQHGGGGPFGPATFFVSAEKKEDLVVFAFGLGELDNYLLIGSPFDLNSKGNDILSQDIQSWANSNTSEFRALYGMHSFYVIVVYDIYEEFLEGQYRFFNFLQTFTSLGFVVGILGLMVVSLRAVSERKREIGMLRSIGYKKLDVILAVIFELIALSIIGWLIGMFNGLVMAQRLIDVSFGDLADFVIPWYPHILIYSVITFGASFIAAIIPGWLASRIPPSEALRYQG
ncbi:MAG: ABC transporter permease [Candidatus Kariarchaeaceae archaeon]